jgi:hypothetical protein
MSSYLPAYEDGTNRMFRNVGIQNSDAGDLPGRKHTVIFNFYRYVNVAQNFLNIGHSSNNTGNTILHSHLRVYCVLKIRSIYLLSFKDMSGLVLYEGSFRKKSFDLHSPQELEISL